MEAVVSLLICVYFDTISKNWIPLMFFRFIYVYFMPETPRFLVSQKKFVEAREVFAKMARFNRTTVDTSVFVFENEVA